MADAILKRNGFMNSEKDRDLWSKNFANQFHSIQLGAYVCLQSIFLATRKHLRNREIN